MSGNTGAPVAKLPWLPSRQLGYQMLLIREEVSVDTDFKIS